MNIDFQAQVALGTSGKSKIHQKQRFFGFFDPQKTMKDQLAGIAALIAAIVAIGGGFAKYGEITTKLADIESLMDRDTFIAPEDAVKLGLIDKVVENREDIK